MGGGVHLITAGQGRLTREGHATLDANGKATVELGFVPGGQVWLVTRIAVSCTGSNNPMPQCNVYDGPETPGNRIDGTYTGALDASDFPQALVLSEQQSLLFVWTGGVPGTVGTARLVGFQQSA